MSPYGSLLRPSWISRSLWMNVPLELLMSIYTPKMNITYIIKVCYRHTFAFSTHTSAYWLGPKNVFSRQGHVDQRCWGTNIDVGRWTLTSDVGAEKGPGRQVGRETRVCSTVSSWQANNRIIREYRWPASLSRWVKTSKSKRLPVQHLWRSLKNQSFQGFQSGYFGTDFWTLNIGLICQTLGIECICNWKKQFRPTKINSDPAKLNVTSLFQMKYGCCNNFCHTFCVILWVPSAQHLNTKACIMRVLGQEESKIGDLDMMPPWEYDTLIRPHNHKIGCKVIDELITCRSKKSCDKSWINRLFWAHSQFQQFPVDYPPKKLH
jgi:hypothetical protein